jgi:hypothetical protein
MPAPVEFTRAWSDGHRVGIDIASRLRPVWCSRYQVATGQAWQRVAAGEMSAETCRAYLTGVWHGVIDGREAF